MGPGPPPKKGGSKNASQRALNTAGQGSSYAGSTAMSSETPSSPTAVTEGSRISGEGWNRKRYQREDEALWGHDIPGPGQRIIDAIAKAGSSAGRLLEGRLSKSGPLKEEENPGSYYLARNPPVNELHPPVVSTAPASKDETRWMLQPPPPARVMEGKERVNRSRASSNGSSRRGNDAPPLSRQVTERLVDAKLQRGEKPYDEPRSLSSRSKPQTPNQPRAQPPRRARSISLDSTDSSDTPTRRKTKPSPISIAASRSNTRDTIEHIPIRGPSSLVSGTELPARPPLTTILSSSNAVEQISDETMDTKAVSKPSTLPDNMPNAQNSALLPVVDDVLNALPSVKEKFPGSSTFRFPPPVAVEDEIPDNRIAAH